MCGCGCVWVSGGCCASEKLRDHHEQNATTKTHLFNGLVNLIWVGQLLVGLVAVRHDSKHQETVRIYVHLVKKVFGQAMKKRPTGHKYGLREKFMAATL